MLIDSSQNEYSQKALSNFNTNKEFPRHRWLEFKEGFSADLVRIAVDDCCKKRPRILDPFAGSGTTVVEAGRNGLDATGIEVNPFLFDVTVAKCHPRISNAHDLRFWRARFLEEPAGEMLSPLEGVSTFTETSKTTKWIFNTSVLRGYEFIRQALDGEKHSWARAMKIALLSALMDSSNVRRDGKCVRYRKDWRKNGFTSSTLRQRFAETSAAVMNDLLSDPFTAKCTNVVNGDARSELRRLPTASHDLVVTSPPYLNSFDYSDVYRPELFAGGYVKDNLQLRAVRHRTIRSHVQVERTFASTSTSLLLDPVLAELSSRSHWNRKIPGMIASYFWDMKNILTQLYRIVRKTGSCWIVVSTSAYSGVQIPVDLVLADVGTQCGWKLRGVYVLRSLRASGQHWSHLAEGTKLPLRESLIVFDK